MWKRFFVKPFETSVAVFVIINGILTLLPESVVRDSLWNIIGYPSVVIPVVQIAAGLCKIVGIAIGRANIEAAGLIAVATMFAIRAISLVADGDISPSDINAITICMGIISSNIVRISQILLDLKILFIKCSTT